MKLVGILAGIIVIILVGIVEFGLHLRVRRALAEKPPHILHIEKKPSVEKLSKAMLRSRIGKPGVYRTNIRSEKFHTYTINSRGFRTPEFKNKKNPDTTRIITLGGSFVLGLATEDDETYPYYLQQLLGSDYEVINGGISGHALHQINELLRERIINYEPDIIVLSSSDEDSYRKPSIVYKKPPRLFRMLYNRSMIFTYIVEKASLIKNKTPIPSACIKSYAPVESYIDKLESIISFVQKNGIEIILIIQPPQQIFQINFAQESIESLNKRIKRSSNTQEIRFLTEYLMGKHVERLAQENNLTFINPIAEFDKHRSYYIDHAHLSPKGNKRLAEIVYNYLRTNE